MLYTSVNREQKIKILTQDTYKSETAFNDVISAQKLVDDISEVIQKSKKVNPNNPITWGNVIKSIEEIQKQQNKDATFKAYVIDNFVDELNKSFDTLGTKFKATVSFLAKHSHHVFGSKINWFGHINKTNSITKLIERCTYYQDLQSVENISRTKKSQYMVDIANKKFIEDPKMLKQLAAFIGVFEWNLVSDQLWLAEAIRDQKFGENPEVLKILFNFIGRIQWVDEYPIHEIIAQAIRDQKFGQNPEVLKIIDEYEWIYKVRKEILPKISKSISALVAPEELCRLNQLNRYLQNIKRVEDSHTHYVYERIFIESISGQVFVKNLEVLKIFAESIGKIIWANADSHVKLAKAIYDQNFGENPEVLKILAESIGKITWTDSVAQIVIAQAIRDQKFGTDPEVLKILAESIGKIIWWANSHVTLAKAIYDQKFGENPEVLKILAESIGKIIWANSHVKLAQAIYDQKFGEDPEVLKILAESIGKINWNDLYAQEKLAQAIYDQKFGQNPEVLKILVEFIGKINWNYPSVQMIIAQAIRDQKFGENLKVLKILSEFSCQIQNQWANKEAVKIITDKISSLIICKTNPSMEGVPWLWDIVTAYLPLHQ